MREHWWSVRAALPASGQWLLAVGGVFGAALAAIAALAGPTWAVAAGLGVILLASLGLQVARPADAPARRLRSVIPSRSHPDGSVARPARSLVRNADGDLSDRDHVKDLVLVMLGLLSMTYGSLVLYNTGAFSVNQSTITTFGYTPPLSSMVACLLLYPFGFACLLGVGSDWAPPLNAVSLVVTVLYLGVGAVFYRNVFGESSVRQRVQGGKTDAYVLQTEAAERLLNGQNPYLYDYSGEILKQVPGYFRTALSPTYGVRDLADPSNIVTNLDYPPISFLWYLPSELLGIEPAIQDIVALGVIIGVLVLVAPKSFRLTVPVFFMLNWNMVLFPASFVPDMAWVSLVVVAIFTVQYPRTNAVVWALAASYRPQPILVASFFAIFVYKEFGLSYLKQWVPTGLLATLAINVPFALWTGPRAYVGYVTLPVRITIPPGGVGPAMVFSSQYISQSAAYQYHHLFTYAVVGVWLLSLVVTYAYYDRLGAGALALPAVALFFHWRSFENYLLWFPLFVLTAYLVGFPHTDPLRLLQLRLRQLRASLLPRRWTTGSHENDETIAASDGE